MKVEIDVDDATAETILFALTLRSKQKGLSPQMAAQALHLGEALNTTFEKALGWDGPYDRMKSYRYPIKSVSLKCYDLAPEE